jgi:hypothetical protein
MQPIVASAPGTLWRGIAPAPYDALYNPTPSGTGTQTATGAATPTGTALPSLSFGQSPYPTTSSVSRMRLDTV